MAEQEQKSGQARRQPRTLQGVVRSSQGDKTVVVSVNSRVMHKAYKKYVGRRRSFMAHDERNECRDGDVVKIVSSRPLSRHKRWRVVELVERAS